VGELPRDLETPGVELEETHISWVFLGDRDVYKVKKPVDLGFLDFTGVEERRRACEAEVTLNRRLAPGVYRGVVPITAGPDGRFRVGGEGAPVDWAVHMRRLPAARRGDHLLRGDRLSRDQLTSVAERIAVFHGEALCDETTASFGSPEAIGRNVRENFRQTRDSIAAYLSADMFIQALKKAGKNPTSESIQKAAAKMKYAVKGFVGPTKYPKGFKAGTPCGQLAHSDGTAWDVAVPFQCFTNINVNTLKPIKY